MEKVPLTSAGTRRKTEELYALSPGELDGQARLIIDQFDQWMDDNFILNGVQKRYIAELNTDFKIYLSSELFASVRTRLPIVVNIPDVPPLETGTKRIEIGKDSVKSIHSGVNSLTEGAITITITYDR